MAKKEPNILLLTIPRNQIQCIIPPGMFEKWFQLGEKEYSEEDAAWDEFVTQHPHGSLLQSTQWARLKNRFGWSSHRVWMKKDGRFVAGAQILYRSKALGVVKIGYIPHGPLVDWADPEQVEILFNQIDQSVYQHGAGLLKMEPLLWQDTVSPSVWATICESYNLVATDDTIQPPRTMMIDIRPPEDEILAAMKSKTRYNIRLSARKGVTVREGSADDLPVFNQLMRLTGQRDGFGVHASEYYRDAFEFFGPDQVVMLIAEFEQRPLAAVMVFAHGTTAAYLYGASSNAERNRMPAYAAQWAAIQWAQNKGCTHYDMWGVPDAELDELEAHFTKRQDGLWPVYRFKRGFGGNIQRTVGAVDRIYNQRLYRLYNWYRKR